MTATRSTKQEYEYRRYSRANQDGGCRFCEIQKGDPQYVEETKNLKVIHNKFPYSVWDSQGVADHLMIVPKVHTDKLGELQPEAAAEFIKLVERYEAQDYNLYARAPQSSMKSVSHQHSHLIKLDGTDRKFLFVVRRPFYFRFSR